MLLGKRFKDFIESSPVSVMIRGTLERVLDPDKLQQVFDDNAVRQYTRELTFAQCGEIMSDVVFRVSPTVAATCDFRNRGYLRTHHFSPAVS